VTNNVVLDSQSGINATGANDLLIDGNDVDGSSWGINVDTSTNVVISNNVVTNSDQDGIDIWDVNMVTITGNTVSGSAGDGIWVGGYYDAALNVTITGNDISDNGNGGLWPSAGGVHVSDGTDLTSLVITGNTFTGNLAGVSNSTTGGGTVVALGNFWGCPLGPDDPACDSVYNDVLYDPWLIVNPFAPLPVAEPAAPAAGPARRTILPTTGGEMLDLSCDEPVTLVILNNTHRVEFKGLCGYQAMIEEVPAEGLPGALPDGETYTTSLEIGLFQNGNPVDVLPAGTSIKIDFLLDAGQVDDPFSVLFWNPEANSNAGAWVTLPGLGDAPGLTALDADANDGRSLMNGTWTTADGYVSTELNFTGTFVLVTP
jgi:parallel beta-helix repeat protein